MKLKKIFTIITVLLLTLVLTSCKLNIKRYYKDFSKISTEYCDIPGLNTKFVPQGMAYNEKYELILVTGYNSDDAPSPIFVLDKKGNQLKKVTFKLESGKEYKGHAGGIVTFNDIVFVSSGKKVYKLDLNKIMNAKDSEAITVDKTTKVDLDGATLFVYDKYLFVTEFYYPKDYETDPTHHIKTSNNVNKALAFGYEIDENDISGLKSNIPQKAISLPGKVQGMLVTEDSVYLSTSYGRTNDSYIRKYKNVFDIETENFFDYNGTSLELYIIDEENMETKLLAPSMSEGICLVDGKLLILFESGAKKYRLTTKCEVYSIWECNL